MYAQLFHPARFLDTKDWENFCLNRYIQWLPFENGQSPFYVVNEVNLTGQKPSLKFYQHLELLTQFKKGLDLLMLKIWGL